MAIDPAAGNADYVDSLQLLSTYFRHNLKPFVTTGDTSAATALATRMAAVLMAQYPDYWPETIRALLVHSAEWTEKMLERFNPQKKRDYENLLRYVGYGVPDLNSCFVECRKYCHPDCTRFPSTLPKEGFQLCDP